MIRHFALAALVASLAVSPALAKPAPKMSIASFAELKTPLPYPYEEKADANAAVAKAKAKARTARKLLIIDLGGNWCGDCRILAATMELPELKAFIRQNYEVVAVDTGRFDKNLQIPARYGITGRLKGVPSLLVIDPRTDVLLNKDVTAALADARHMSPQALADWLAQWTR
jgi:thiol-disulfide isomerase/thioredoxin